MRCSDRAASEFAARRVIRSLEQEEPEIRVAHRDTGARGTVTAIRLRLNTYDTQGPWASVTFDDGLQCWVPDARLEVVTD